MKKPKLVEAPWARVGGQVVDKFATVMASPVIIKSKRKIRQADKDVKTLKLARSYDNAPDFNEDGSVSDAFKARSNAEVVKARLRKKK